MQKIIQGCNYKNIKLQLVYEKCSYFLNEQYIDTYVTEKE